MSLAVRFSTVPGLGVFGFSGTLTSPPPTLPPRRLNLGGYCVKATCELHEKDGKAVGRVIGYDTRDNIQQRVSEACEFRRSGVRGQKCGEVQLTLLPYRRDLQCQGEMYFELDGMYIKRL